MNKHRLPATILACIFLSGCSHYVGNKLGSAGDYAKDSRGIPFQMTKPVYSLTITPNAEDPARADYAIVAEDVPDANQRYAIALAPGLLTDGGFEFNYGPHGNLNGGNAALASRTVAVLESIAATVLDFKAAAGMMDSADALERFINAVQQSADRSCTAIDRAAGVSAAAAIVSQLNALGVYGATLAPDGAARASIGLYYHRSQAERDCLIAVHRALAGYDKTNVDKRKAAWVEAKAKVADKTAVKELDALVAARDTKAVQSYLNKVQANGSSAEGLEELAAAALEYLNQLDTAEAPTIGKKFAYMDERVWRARHVLDLERDLATRQRTLMLLGEQARAGAAGQAARAAIARIEARRGDALEAADIVARMARIRLYLSEIRTGGAERKSAADEHVKLAAEYERLAALLAKRRQDLLAANDEPAPKKDKVVAQTGLPVTLVQGDFIARAKTLPLDKLPPYILVLEPDLDAAVLETPPPASDTAKKAGAQ